MITGGSGYIGEVIIEKLLKEYSDKYDIIAIGRTPVKNVNSIKFIKWDIKDKNEQNLYELFGQPDICLHLAWEDGFNHNKLEHVYNVFDHIKFLINLANSGVKHFCVAGTFREYGSARYADDDRRMEIARNYYVAAKIFLYSTLNIYFNNKKDCLFQWIRPFSVIGNDERNNSIFSKIIQWEAAGKQSFPFTDGQERYDFIGIEEAARQIINVISQEDISGIIDICTGSTRTLEDMVKEFIQSRNFSIRPKYGAFEKRSYDPAIMRGNNSKILEIEKLLENMK